MCFAQFAHCIVQLGNFCPTKIEFQQGAMRPHLVQCFEEGKLTVSQ